MLVYKNHRKETVVKSGVISFSNIAIIRVKRQAKIRERYWASVVAQW